MVFARRAISFLLFVCLLAMPIWAAPRVVHTPTSISINARQHVGQMTVRFKNASGDLVGEFTVDLADPAANGPIVFTKSSQRHYHSVHITGLDRPYNLKLDNPLASNARVPLTDSYAVLESGVTGALAQLPKIRLPKWSDVRTVKLSKTRRSVNIADFRRLVRASENPPSTYLRTPIANQTAHPDDPTRKSVYLAASNPLFDPGTGKASSLLHYLIEIPIDPSWLMHDDAEVTTKLVDPATIRAHIDVSTTQTSNGAKRITGERSGGLTQLLNGSLVGEDGNLYFARPYRGPIRFNIKTARFEATPIDLWQWYYNHLNEDGAAIASLHPDVKPRPDFDNMIYNHNGRIFVMFGRYYVRRDDALVAAVLSIPQEHWNDPERFAKDIRIHAESYPTAPNPLFDHLPDADDQRYKLRVLSGVGNHLLLWSNSFDRLWRIDLDDAGHTERVVSIAPTLDGRKINKFHEIAQWKLKGGKPVGAVISAQCEGDDKMAETWLAVEAINLSSDMPAGQFETYDTRLDYSRKQHMEFTRKLGYGESRFRKANLAREIGVSQTDGFLTLIWDAAPAIRAAAERADPDLVERMLGFSSGPGFMIAPVPGNLRQIIGATDYPSYYLSRYEIGSAQSVERVFLRSRSRAVSSLALVGLGPYGHQWTGASTNPALWVAGYTGVVRFKFAEDSLVQRRQFAWHMKNVQSPDNATAGPIKWFTDVKPGLNDKMFAVGLNKIARGGTSYSAGLRWSTTDTDGSFKWHALSRLARTAITRNITTRLRIAPDGARSMNVLLAGSSDNAMAKALESANQPRPSGARVFVYEDLGSTVVDRYSFTLTTENGDAVRPIETALSGDGLHALILMQSGTLATLYLDTMQFIDAVRLPAALAMTNVQRRSYALMPTPDGGFLLALKTTEPVTFPLVQVSVSSDGRIRCQTVMTLNADNGEAFKGAAALVPDEDGSANLLVGPPAMSGDATLIVVRDVIPPGRQTLNQKIGDRTYSLTPLLIDDFDDMANWINVTPNTKWWTQDGKLHGHWGSGGSDLWSKQIFHGDLYIEFTATLQQPDPSWINNQLPEGGKNINLRLHVTGPNGVDIVEAYPKLSEKGVGPNAVGDDLYHGYFFTFTHTHARLRRSPGYDNVSEDLKAIPELNRTYIISMLKTGGRLQYFVDGRKIHDYIDSEPHESGRIGLTLWRSRVAVEDFKVYHAMAID